MPNTSRLVNNLNASTIKTLVATVSRFQAVALRDLFYRHLGSKTSIGVTIPVSISGSDVCTIYHRY
jgi:hypothetical protein